MAMQLAPAWYLDPLCPTVELSGAKSESTQPKPFTCVNEKGRHGGFQISRVFCSLLWHLELGVAGILIQE